MSFRETFKQSFPATVTVLKSGRKFARTASLPLRHDRVARGMKRNRLTLDEVVSDQRHCTLFFAPQAGVGPHFATLMMLARTLKDRGHRVLMIGCFETYPRCVVMDSVKVPLDDPAARKQLCTSCGQISLDWAKDYGLDFLNIGDLVDLPVHDRIGQIIANLPEDLSTFTLDGVNFGALCASEAAVNLKSLDFSGKDAVIRTTLLKYLEGALLSYFGTQKLLRAIPVQRIVFFSEYAMMMGAQFAGEAAQVPFTNLTHTHIMGINRQFPSLSPHKTALLAYQAMQDDWANWRDLALPSSRVDAILQDSMFRFAGNSGMVYSVSRSGSTEQVYERLRLSPKKKLLVAFTSSLDEISANRMLLKALNAEPLSPRQPFADQISWISALIAKVEASDDLQLVVRIHPREDANIRDNITSDHMKMLRAAFSGEYRSCRIIWPRDAVSSYDLMELADVGLTSWSNTGLEMARLGVPVVFAFHRYTPFPVGDVADWGPDPESHMRCIDRALTAVPDIRQIQYATRWMNLRMFGNSVDLGDLVPNPHYEKLPPFRMPANAEVVEDILVSGASPMTLNHDTLAQSQNAGARERELAATQRGLRSFVWLLSHGNVPAGDYRLHFGACDKLPSATDAAVWVEDGVTIFRSADGLVRRHSPMAARLARIAAQTRTTDIL